MADTRSASGPPSGRCPDHGERFRARSTRCAGTMSMSIDRGALQCWAATVPGDVTSIPTIRTRQQPHRNALNEQFSEEESTGRWRQEYAMQRVGDGCFPKSVLALTASVTVPLQIIRRLLRHGPCDISEIIAGAGIPVQEAFFPFYSGQNKEATRPPFMNHPAKSRETRWYRRGASVERKDDRVCS